MSQERIEAAARAIAEQDRRRPNSFHQAQARDALQAADAHDAAHGVHRVNLDDATVERAARALMTIEGYGWLSRPANIHTQHARTILAAAIGEEE